MRALFFLATSILLALPGCGRWVDWGKRTFYQGKKINGYAALARSYIRCVSVYDQFSTRAIFDALWLSDEVRSAYVHVHATRVGKSGDARALLLSRQREENSRFISFYVLSLYDNNLGGMQDEWAVGLTIMRRSPSGKIEEIALNPLEIKPIDLAPEYRAFLTEQLSRFKNTYQVTFEAYDADGNSLIDESTRELRLQFRSPDRQAFLSWSVQKGGKALTPVCMPADEPYGIRRPCQNEAP